MYQFSSANYLTTTLIRALHKTAYMRLSLPIFALLFLLSPTLQAQRNKDAIAIGYYKFQENGKVGLKDSAGNILLPAQYNYIMSLDYSSVAGYKPLPLGIIKASVGKFVSNTETHWKLFNAEGKPISDNSFSYVSQLTDSLLKVGRGSMEDIGHKERYGVQNLNGEIQIPMKYSNLELYNAYPSPETSLFIIRLDSKNRAFQIINIKDEVVNGNIYEDINPHGPLHKAKIGGKCGYLDNKGKEIIPFIYDEFYGFNGDDCLAVKNKQWGTINKKGETIIPFDYQNLYFLRVETAFGCLYRANKNDRVGLIDTAGQVILPHQYLHVEPHQLYLGNKGEMNQFKVKTIDNKVGIIDIKTQTYIIPPDYNFFVREIDQHQQVLWVSQKGTKFGILDSSGQVKTPFDYESIFRLERSDEFLFSARKGDKFGVIDGWTGATVYPFIYKNIQRQGRHPPEYTLTLVQKDSITYTCIDGKGEVTRIQKQFNSNFGHSQITAIIGGRKKYAWQTFEGDTLTEFYDVLHSFQMGWSLCLLNRKLGVLNRDGELILPTIYDDIRLQSSSQLEYMKVPYFAVKVGDKWGLVNEKNVFIVAAQYDGVQDAWRNWKR